MLDYMLGYSWEWTYSKMYDGKYTISNLHTIQFAQSVVCGSNKAVCMEQKWSASAAIQLKIGKILLHMMPSY